MEFWTLTGLDMGLCLKLCPQWHNTEVLSSAKKTLKDKTAVAEQYLELRESSILKDCICCLLHSISDTADSIMAGGCWSCLEGETTRRRVHLIGYSSRGWLWDCLWDERNSGAWILWKPRTPMLLLVIFSLSISQPSAPCGPLRVQAMMKSVWRDRRQPTPGLQSVFTLNFKLGQPHVIYQVVIIKCCSSNPVLESLRPDAGIIEIVTISNTMGEIEIDLIDRYL